MISQSAELFATQAAHEITGEIVGSRRTENEFMRTRIVLFWLLRNLGNHVTGNTSITRNLQVKCPYVSIFLRRHALWGDD